MKKTMRKLAAAVLGLCLLISGLWIAPVQADASGGDGWVGAWSTSPVEFNLKKMLDLDWIKCDVGLHNLTFRTRIQPTISGEDVRITLSNEFGTGPLTVDTVSVAKGYEKLPQAIKTWTRKNVTFNGQASVTIPAGETVTSDPIGMSVDALEYLTVSLFLKRTETMKTYGLIGGDTYIMSGNFAKAATTIGVPMKMEADFGEYSVIPALTGVEVYAPEASSAVVIGDSTLANDIPILLAEKLQNAGITNVGILQQAIKGNRLLDDGAGILGMAYGEAMVDRFERDALNQPGVERIFLKVGVNDVVHPNCESLKGEARAVTAEEMIAGYKQLIEQAHERGIEVYLFTRTAWKGYTRNVLGSDDVQWSPEIDQMRQDINAWIRSSDNPADGYIDLDFMCTDETASELKSEYTTDGAHFTALGQQAVADAVPLEYFQ